MINEIQHLLDSYIAWLKDKTTLRQIGDDSIVITTPYLDRHNDYLQIYAKRRNGGYLLTDDGYVLEDLEQSGCTLDTEKRQALLRITLNGFGVQLSSGRALEVHASTNDFALRKHNLVQAMLAVNDLFYLAVPMVSSLFYEDAVAWLDMNGIRYTPRVKFTGKSGYDHLFDFVIPKSRNRPERILDTITRSNRQTAENAILKWIDTKEVRPAKAQAYVLLNDRDYAASPIPPAVLDALRNYDLKPVLWSQREQSVREFVS